MSPASELFDLRPPELAERLSRPPGPSEDPGVGSACTLQAALGAALFSMAVRSAHRDPGRKSVYPLARADELDVLRGRLFELGAEDARVFRRFLESEVRGPASGPGDEREARQAEELRQACIGVPLEMLETALSCLRLALPGSEELGADQRCDLAVGARAALGGAEGAFELVRANVERLGPERYASRLELAVSLREEARSLAARLSPA